MIALSVKYGSDSHDITLPGDSKVSTLQEELERRTGVFQKHQKLIYKGKVLDPGAMLHAYKFAAGGAKLMLLVGQGSNGVQTKGQQAAAAIKKQKQEDAAARVEAAFAAVRSGGTASSMQQQQRLQQQAGLPGFAPIKWEERRAGWQKTGVVALRGLGLQQLAEDVFSGPCSSFMSTEANSSHSADAPGVSTASADDSDMQAAPSSGPADKAAVQAGERIPPDSLTLPGPLSLVRAADLSHNQLQQLPSCISTLCGLSTLKLGHNQISDEGMPWTSLAALSGLTYLELDNNKLTKIPEAALVGLPLLQRLTACSNALEALPDSISSLTNLEVLSLDGNRLTSLPESLGMCSALVEVSACSNRLCAIPSSMCQLGRLQSLRLSNNLTQEVPSSLLEGCVSLSMLQLDGNPITLNKLRATPGFGAYDARRRAKCDKLLEGGAMFDVNRSFSEGADQELYQHWHQDKRL